MNPNDAMYCISFFVTLYSCVKLSKNIKKCLLFIIIHICSTHFAIDLFCLPNLKRKQNSEQQPHHAYELTKSK